MSSNEMSLTTAIELNNRYGLNRLQPDYLSIKMEAQPRMIEEPDIEMIQYYPILGGHYIFSAFYVEIPARNTINVKVYHHGSINIYWRLRIERNFLRRKGIKIEMASCFLDDNKMTLVLTNLTQESFRILQNQVICDCSYSYFNGL